MQAGGELIVMMSEPIRLLLVDDHPVVRDGLRGMFANEPGLEVIGEASDGRQAVDKAAALEPDVVLMDLRMPSMDGVAAIREIVARQLPTRVLVLTTYDTDRDVVAAIEAGATGYLLKDAPREELLRAVDDLQQSIMENYPQQVSRSYSLVNIVKDINQVMNNDDPAFYTVPDSEVMVSQLLYLFNSANPEDRRQLVSADLAYIGGLHQQRRADLGDARCGIALDDSAYRGAGSIVEVLGASLVRVAGLDSFANDWFTRGRLTFTGGPNAGLAVEVKEHRIEADGVRLALWQRMPAPLAEGDLFAVTAGCDKRFESCRAKFANAVNFRGFPHLPGNDFVARYAVPGEPGHDGGPAR